MEQLNVRITLTWAKVPKTPHSRSVPLSTNTGSPQTLQQAYKWIKKCSSDHEICRQALKRELWCPTRLLNIGDPSRKIDLFIIETRPSRPSKNFPPYLTLSHCWGKGSIAKLTKSNLKELKKRIPASLMPKTFRDAMTIARCLKVQHVWIDSLCIIQDSEDDWQHESALMHKVYRYGYCNIAATASADGEGGCFYPREACSMPALLAPYEVLCNWKGGTETSYCLSPQEIWKLEVQNAPLNQRGWALEEYLLSPRSFHFTSNQVYWSCKKSKSCELWPQGLSHIAQNYSEPSIVSPALNPEDVPAIWDNLIRDYSRTRLTFLNDRLVAISGVVKEFQHVLNDEYVAGLWRSQFAWCLNWSWSRSANGIDQPLEYRAPSWSWASVQGEIYSDTEIQSGEQPLLRLIDVDIETVSPDPTGQIRSGYVRVQCRVCTGKWLDDMIHQPMIRFDQSEFASGSFNLDPCGADSTKTCYFMGTVGSEATLRALILQHTGNKRGEYRRVGAASFFRMGEDSFRQWDALMEQIDNDPLESEHPCEEYDKVLGHTITLV